MLPLHPPKMHTRLVFYTVSYIPHRIIFAKSV